MTLAELAGDRLSVSLISKIERGLIQPSLATLDYLAQRLDVSPGELLGGAAAETGTAALSIARARDALIREDPASALRALGTAKLGEAALLRARALTSLGRREEALAALAPVERDEVLVAEATLVRANIAARWGPFDAAQTLFARALELIRSDDDDLRAEALLGLATLAERGGATATARTLERQARDVLRRMADAAARSARWRREADRMAADGDEAGAAAALAAAGALTAMTRAAAEANRVEGRLRADEQRAGAIPTPARFPSAHDATTHRLSSRRS
jgi:transcriptional regulator with XRE-family HTH domain